MLDVREVRTAIAYIQELADTHQDEIAHQKEAFLRKQILGAIASGAPNAVELANLGLSTNNIHFQRSFAL